MSLPISIKWFAMQLNRRRRHNAAVVAAPPVDMPEDFVARFKASTIDLEVGDSIWLWPDLSGNVNDAVQNTVSCQPTLQSVTFAGNTFAVTRFDTVDDGMETSLYITGPFSIFMFWRPADF